jgi:hypothetical protein
VIRRDTLDWRSDRRVLGAHPETRTFGELLIDLEKDKAARAVVFGLLRGWSGSSPDASQARLGDYLSHSI